VKRAKVSYKFDLEEHIRKSYNLICQYEAIIQTSADPKEQARARRNIKEQWKFIKGYLDEYIPLCNRLNDDTSEDLVEIVAHFPEYKPQFSQPKLLIQTLQPELLAEINSKLDTLITGQSKIYNAGLQERQAIVHILGIMEIRNEARHKEMFELVNRLQEWARRVEKSGLPSDPELRQAVAQLAAPIDEAMGINHYLEATLPLVPGILAYKFEFGAEHKVDLQALWDEIKKRFQTGH
jgi:hypothetical protein